MDKRSGIAALNGTQLYYELAGSGPAVTLIHGFSLDCRMWDDQFDAFAQDFRVLRYDLRGFGRSAAATVEPYTPAADLCALLDHLGIDRTAVVGLSMGGGFAIDFALAYPARTQTLVAADSALGGFDWPHGRPSAWHAEMAAADGVDAARAAWLDCSLFHPAARDPAVASRLAAIVADYSGWHWLNPNPISLAEPPAIDRLGEIGCPTLVIIGERDEADFHVVAERLHADIPGAELHRLADTGHMSNMEAPASFNDAVLGFLRRQSPDR